MLITIVLNSLFPCTSNSVCVCASVTLTSSFFVFLVLGAIFLRIKTAQNHLHFTGGIGNSENIESSSLFLCCSPPQHTHTTHHHHHCPASHTQPFKFNLTVFHYYVIHTDTHTLALNSSLCVCLVRVELNCDQLCMLLWSVCGATHPPPFCRYVGDMLAWLHQATASEKEHLEALLKNVNQRGMRFPVAQWPRVSQDSNSHMHMSTAFVCISRCSVTALKFRMKNGRWGPVTG